MTKQEIMDRFRQENPEITTRVISNSVLEAWAEVGELEIATFTRCIRKKISFTSIVDEDSYDLSAQEPLFFDIDEFPGGGIIYNNKRLVHTTFAILDEERANWRSQSSGTPYDYVRFNESIMLGRKASSAQTILAYLVVRSNAFNSNSAEPFNEFEHLLPFHYSIVLYLTKRAKGKIGKDKDVKSAMAEYAAYIKWMKSLINRGIFNEIKMRPAFRNRGYRYRR